MQILDASLNAAKHCAGPELLSQRQSHAPEVYACTTCPCMRALARKPHYRIVNMHPVDSVISAIAEMHNVAALCKLAQHCMCVTRLKAKHCHPVAIRHLPKSAQLKQPVWMAASAGCDLHAVRLSNVRVNSPHTCSVSGNELAAGTGMMAGF